MRILTWIIGLTVLCNAPMAYAGDHWGTNSNCNPCNTQNQCCDTTNSSWRDCCGCLEWTAYVDYLYWKVCRADLSYIAAADLRKYINPGYDSGFRVGARAQCNCVDFGFRYTKFDSTATASLPMDGRVKYKLDFNYVDLELGYTIQAGCECATFRPVVGAKLSWADETRDRRESPQSGEGKSTIDHNGYGLYFGAEGILPITEWTCGCNTIPVSLVARGTTGILEGHFSGKEIDNGEPDRGNECNFIPVNEAFVGLQFSFCECERMGNAFLQIGYEAQYWGWREFESTDDLSSIGFGGLVARFGADF